MRLSHLYKRVCLSVGPLVRRSVGPSVGPSVRNAFVSAGRDEPANDLYRVHELVPFDFSAKFCFYISKHNKF